MKHVSDRLNYKLAGIVALAILMSAMAMTLAPFSASAFTGWNASYPAMGGSWTSVSYGHQMPNFTSSFTYPTYSFTQFTPQDTYYGVSIRINVR